MTGSRRLTTPFKASTSSAEPLQTVTILTGKHNDLIAPIHNRMPIIVRPEHYDLWLDPAIHDPASVLEPYPADSMETLRDSPRVNSLAIQDPSLLDPCPEPPRETLW